MTRSGFKRGLLISYLAFAGVRSTLVAQLLIVALMGAITIAGMGYVQKHEARTSTADRMQ